MKKKFRMLALLMCMVMFAAMALGSGESSGKDIDGANVSSGQKITIEGQELVNQSGIIVTATEYVTDSIWGQGIKLSIENNSEKNCTVSCKALIVNGFMLTDFFSCEVAAGKKATDTLYLSSSELEASGITTVGEIEVYFKVYNSDTWEDIFVTDCVTIRTSAYDNMDTTPDDAGAELYNEGGIRIVGKKVDENSFWGKAILLYIENNTDKNIDISVQDVSVNGYMVTSIMSADVYAGKKAFDDISLLSSDLEQNNITSIENVEFKFHIYNSDTYDTITDTPVIKMSFK
ncbi:MAG: hypothetical protein ACI4E1_07945 [Lachnospira sp.]